jgi:hypothetical protein
VPTDEKVSLINQLSGARLLAHRGRLLCVAESDTGACATAPRSFPASAARRA